MKQLSWGPKDPEEYKRWFPSAKRTNTFLLTLMWVQTLVILVVIPLTVWDKLRIADFFVVGSLFALLLFLNLKLTMSVYRDFWKPHKEEA